jgi:hypothetical protein
LTAAIPPQNALNPLQWAKSQNFRPIPLVLPPKEVMNDFTAKAAPRYAQMTANLHQSRTLATLRDPAIAGLPKLLNGELSAGEAAKRDSQ